MQLCYSNSIANYCLIIPIFNQSGVVGHSACKPRAFCKLQIAPSQSAFQNQFGFCVALIGVSECMIRHST